MKKGVWNNFACGMNRTKCYYKATDKVDGSLFERITEIK